jgi:hypothetical protein
MIHPRIQLNTVEGDALPADRYLGERRSDFRIESISVHAQVSGDVTQSQEAWRHTNP